MALIRRALSLPAGALAAKLHSGPSPGNAAFYWSAGTRKYCLRSDIAGSLLDAVYLDQRWCKIAFQKSSTALIGASFQTAMSQTIGHLLVFAFCEMTDYRQIPDRASFHPVPGLQRRGVIGSSPFCAI